LARHDRGADRRSASGGGTVFHLDAGRPNIRLSAMLIPLICIRSLLQTFNNPRLFVVFERPYALAAVAGAGPLIHLSSRT
jgi:hypothetical protein